MANSASGGSRAPYKISRYEAGDPRSQKHKASGGPTKRPALPKPDAPKVDKQTTQRIQQYDKLAETVRRVGSTFGIRRQEVLDAIERGDLDGSIVAFQRQAYKTVINLIPIAEQEYKKHRRESLAYALKALIGEARELAQDLAASSDRARLAEVLIAESIEPLFKSLLQFIMQQHVVTKGVIAGKLQPQHEANFTAHMDDSLKELAMYLQSSYQLVSTQLVKSITGE